MVMRGSNALIHPELDSFEGRNDVTVQATGQESLVSPDDERKRERVEF